MAILAFIIFLILIAPSVYGIISEYLQEKNSKNEPSDLAKRYEVERMVDACHDREVR